MQDGGFSPARLEQMHEAMAAHVESGRLPGLVTLLSRRGEVVVDAIGETAFDSGDPMQRDTIFRIASVTQADHGRGGDDPGRGVRAAPRRAGRRAAAGAGQPPGAAHASTAELDDTVPANRPITLRDLLTFRSGYGAIFTPPGQSSRHGAGADRRGRRRRAHPAVAARPTSS